MGGQLAQESEVRQWGEEYEEVEGWRRQIWKGKRLRLEQIDVQRCLRDGKCPVTGSVKEKAAWC